MSPDANGQQEASAAAPTAEPFLGLGTWEWDPRSGQLWWSDGIYRVMGVSRDGFAPTLARLAAMTVEEDRWVHDIDAASAAPAAYSIYYRIRRPDGTVRTVREAGGASPHWTTDAPKVIGTIMDVTDRITVLDDAVDGAESLSPPRAGTWRWDSALQTFRASPEALQIVGLSANGMICEQERNQFIHPEDRDRVRRTYEKARRSGGAFTHRYRILRPSGEVRFLEEDGHPKEPGVFESRITDITDRTRLERNLVRAQSTAKLGTWEFDPRTNALWWSEQTYRLLGFEPNELAPSMPLWLSRIHPQDSDMVRRTLDAATMRQQPYSIQYRVRLPNGTTRVMVDQGEFIDGLEVGHLMDITERLRIERTLSRAQAIAGFGSWEWNRRTGQSWWSDELYRVLGVDPATWMHSSRRWLDLVHKKDRPRVMRIHASAAGTGSSYSAQYHIVRPDGDHRLMLEQAECDPDGIYTGVLVDITEHHRAERNLNLAQKIAEIGSWEWSLTSEDHWASDQCYRILGLDPQHDRFDSKTWQSLLHPEERLATQVWHDEALIARRSYTSQYRIVLRDGRERTVIESGEPLSDDRYVGTLVDVTDRVRIERNLAEAQRIARIGSWEVDEISRETRWSDEMYRLFGLTPGAVPASAEVALAHVHPEDRQRVSDAYAETTRSRRPYSIQYRVLRADNQTRTMLEQCEYGNGRFAGYVMDITERERIQRRLAKAQEIGRIGSWEWNPATDQTWISDELLKMLGLGADWSYTHERWFALLHPDDRERVSSAYDEAGARPDGLTIQFRMRQPDGSYRLYYEQSERNATDTFTGILWDITDLTRAQRNMSHAQRIARIGSWEWDVERDEHWWSEECYRILGLDPQTVPATEAAWDSLTHPDDVGWTELDFNDAWRSNKPYRYQYRIIRPDGQVRTVFETGEPIAAGQYAGTVMDVTDRVKMEHRLAESQRIAKLGSWEWNLGTGERWWSDECYRIYDVSPDVPGVQTATWLDKVHPDDRPTVKALIETIPGNPRPYTYRCRLVRADGSVRTVQTHGEPIADFGPSNPIISGTTIDITDRESIEAQLQHAQKMEAVGQLTGGIAHDFNNLLGAILGNLDLLTEEIAPEGRANALVGRAVAAAESGAQLVRRLLAFSRKQTLDAQLTDVNELVVNMLDLLRRTLGDKVLVETSLAAGRIHCLIDRPQTEGALLNLCINARDAMPEGGTVSIKTRTVVFDQYRPPGLHDLQPGAHLVLSVSDTGVGMSRSVMERAFEPFFTTKAAGQGSGLGLSMVYGFVKQSDGHVEIESEPGGGTTVRIYLPMQVGAVVDAAEVQPPLPVPRRGKEVVLVVEDNVDLRGYAVSAVRSFGYRALSAPCAKTAMKLLDTRADIALLFTDIVLKDGLSGIQLADMARRRRPELRVLLTSGYLGDRAVGERAHQPGTFTLAKPFRAADLGRKLVEIFGAEAGLPPAQPAPRRRLPARSIR
ncbi:PAS domain-containing protein [Dongia sedimenti]|uniref:histidine kinase n=1 Tax=Dongia sedimenti TaxID=3064282 RepID=A0ABU0YJI7_9PROT|nr:PAS domain-containing protein [Rhodospirillaceae bacterium R-7]